jgi:nucleotidyltransferase/DNA polymerase involved in DNA repair
MKTMTRIMIGLAVSALLPAAAMGQKVTYDYDRGADFTRLRTYALKDSPTKKTTTEETTTYDNPLVQERINAAVASQLESRGMRRGEEHPDVYVVARQTFETQKNYTVYNPYGWGWGYSPYGWGWSGYSWGWGGFGWDPGYTDIQVRDIIVGTLTIELEDAATGELLWRGVGVKRVHTHSSPTHRDERVIRGVAKIFKNFPTAGAVATSGHDLAKGR